MTLSNYGENSLLDTLLSGTKYISLHDWVPDETGSDELTGGSYARQACTFNAASGGQKSSDVQIEFTGMPSCDIYAFGVWDASSGGNCLITGFLNGSEVGAFTTAEGSNVIRAPYHGFSNDDQVVFSAEPLTDGNFPGNIDNTTVYYVIDEDDEGFKISTSEGGSEETIDEHGGGLYFSALIQHFNAGRTARFAAGAIVCRLS